MRKIKAAFLPAVFLSGIITSSAQNNDIKPGGVDDAVLWHRADMGIDNTGNASTLYKWKDQVVGSIAGATKINVHINTYPSYYIGEYGNSFNFNPFIKFTHIRFKESSTLGDISARPLAGASAADHFSVTYSASKTNIFNMLIIKTLIVHILRPLHEKTHLNICISAYYLVYLG